jgi:hypothetical protein
MPVCVCIYAALIVLESLEINSTRWRTSLEIVQWSLYLLSAVLAALLTYVFSARPDDFMQSSKLYESYTKLQDKEESSIPEGDSSKMLKVEICDFKTKVGPDQVPAVYYNITVKTSSSVSTVKHTYAEFIELNSSLTKALHWLKLPDLPKFDSSRDPITFRMTQLARYLDALCLPEVISGELLDFLGVFEPQRGQILELSSQLITRRASALNITGIDCSEQSDDLSSCVDMLSLFKISIEQWEEVDNHVSYSINWLSTAFAAERLVKHRYKDLYALSQALKYLVSPGKPPNFPPKNFFVLAEDSIFRRAMELQRYLNHVANDPAYLCRELLDFLECELAVETVWRRMTYSVIRVLEMTWESVYTDDNELQILYAIKLERGNQDAVWTVRRRYSEFYTLNSDLENHTSSPLLMKYLEDMRQTRTPMPLLPGRTVKRLTDTDEIEKRKRGLELYLEQCLTIPHVRVCYAFKRFVGEPAESVRHG